MHYVSIIIAACAAGLVSANINNHNEFRLRDRDAKYMLRPRYFDDNQYAQLYRRGWRDVKIKPQKKGGSSGTSSPERSSSFSSTHSKGSVGSSSQGSPRIKAVYGEPPAQASPGKGHKSETGMQEVSKVKGHSSETGIQEVPKGKASSQGGPNTKVSKETGIQEAPPSGIQEVQKASKKKSPWPMFKKQKATESTKPESVGPKSGQKEDMPKANGKKSWMPSPKGFFNRFRSGNPTNSKATSSKPSLHEQYGGQYPIGGGEYVQHIYE